MRVLLGRGHPVHSGVCLAEVTSLLLVVLRTRCLRGAVVLQVRGRGVVRVFAS